MEFKSCNKREYELSLLIYLIGIFKSLLADSISVENAERQIFSPRAIKKLQRQHIDKKIISIVELGCELEDIQSLLPQELESNIQILKQDSMKLLKRKYQELNFE